MENTMMKKQKCFISYNRSDCDLYTIKSMIGYLKTFSKDSIDFLLDEDLEIGKDLDLFMDFLKKVDAIIVLLTPEYKKKADEKIKSGVYSEYKKILERLEEDQENKRNSSEYFTKQSTFCFIPIIFSRDHSNSCPSGISSRKALDFSTLQFKENGKLINKLEVHYETQFKRICSEISAIRSINSVSVREDYEQELHKLLFVETKHDNIVNKPVAQNKELYVKTRSFNGLRSQNAYLFLGRKGCGKSTLGPLLFLFEQDRYKDHIEINVDKIELEYSITMILDNALRSDLDIVIKTADFFKLVWEVLLLYKCCEVLVKEDKNGKLSEYQKKSIPPIKRFLNKIKKIEDSFLNEFEDKQTEKNNNPIFQWSISSVVEYIKKAIQNSRSDKDENFHYDLHTLLKREAVLSDIFSKTVIKNIYAILSECKRKIFVSFDGFDSLFEKFRDKTINHYFDDETRKFRKSIEIGFLEGFLALTMRIKSNRKNDTIYKKIDMCVTVPKDRFFEIKEIQRDSYRYISTFQEIKWTGIELSIMLRKRFEFLYQGKYLSDKDILPQERLMEVIKNLPVLSTLPATSIININNKPYEIDTFLNVLRHTFGRPREILIYYSKLIATARDFIKRKQKIDDFAVSKIISETTFDVIREEFITEFKNYCLNINSILSKFKNSTQILSRLELEEKLGNIHFQFTNGIVKDFNAKFEFLFDVGFIGIEVPNHLKERYKLLIVDIFSFNTDSRAYDILKGDDFEGCKFIIHPIFCEYLGLDLSNQNRPILNMDWDYLKLQDAYLLHV